MALLETKSYDEPVERWAENVLRINFSGKLSKTHTHTYATYAHAKHKTHIMNHSPTISHKDTRMQEHTVEMKFKFMYSSQS